MLLGENCGQTEVVGHMVINKKDPLQIFLLLCYNTGRILVKKSKSVGEFPPRNKITLDSCLIKHREDFNGT